MKTLSSVQLSWLAGFFDGEGCVCLYFAEEKPTHLRPEGRRRYSLQVSIVNTSVEVIHLIQSWFGGKVYKHSNGCWVWKLCARDSQIAFLKAVQPYLHIKASQAIVALEYLETVLDHQKYGYHPISVKSQGVRKSCYLRLSKEKDKYSTKGINRRSNEKTSETAGTPDRTICNEALSKRERSETIMEAPKGDGIVRHSEESEITGGYGHAVS